MTNCFYDVLADVNLTALLDKGRALSWNGIAPVLGRAELSPEAFAAILADDEMNRAEDVARAAVAVRRRRFGNAIAIYAPLYLSNACVNGCRYCGFGVRNRIAQRTLSVDETVREAETLIERGHRHLLLVAGENDMAVSIGYLEDIARVLRPRVASLTMEVRPMTRSEYERLGNAGIDGVTLYQETYHRGAYRAVHPTGPKRDFARRLAAVEAAGAAGMRSIGIGALLGLADWRPDALALMLHARYLQTRFWRSHITVSVPRLRAVPAGFSVPAPVSDRELVRMIVGLRCALHDVGIVLSTREASALRDRVIPLGVTRISAGSTTAPGGYALGSGAGEQFAVEDARSPAQVAASLRSAGFDPVFKDWEPCLHGGHDAT